MWIALLLLVLGVCGKVDVDVKGCVDSCLEKGDSLTPNLMTDSDFWTSNCFCDEDCAKYGDCCKDKTEELGIHQESQWVCESFASQATELFVYMVGTCPPSWADQLVDALCRRKASPYTFVMDVPMISRVTNRTYVNVFCAQCHSDTNALMPSKLRLACPKSKLDCREELANATYRKGNRIWTKGVVEIASLSVFEQDDPWQLVTDHGLRRCRKVADKCDDEEGEDGNITRCPNFANYTYVHADFTIYKNFFCATCNNNQWEDFECNLAAIPQVVQGSTRFSGASFALLLDFNEMHGEWVGRTNDFSKFQKVREDYGKLNFTRDPTNASIVLGCEVIAVYPPNFSFIQNGSVLVHDLALVLNEGKYVLENSETNSSVLWLCDQDDDDNPFWRFSVVQNRLSLVCLTLSVTCLAVHIAVYSSVPKLRNLPGRNLLSLAASLLVAQLLFLGVDQVPYPALCEVMAVVMHFSFLAAFFWMNVMAVDICRTFTSPYYQHDNASQDKNYRRYSSYAWVLPAVIVAIALLLDHSSLAPSLSPRYGNGFCWITRRRALLVFFVVPMAVLLFENIIFFGLTARGIYRTVKTAKVARRCSDRIRFYLYVKLALLMGLGWLLSFVAAYANSEPLWLIFILLNASQGVFILVAFSLKRKVLRLVFERLPCPLRKRRNRSLQTAATSATNLTIAITKLSSSTPQLNQE